MTTAARIEELRKKFDENPRRYFAPLANELRKAGELTQAIALCREHLPKQPGHMSGYIVFGQALFEVGELDEARVVFEQALALDPENLIALHHLGHIARQVGDTATARRWYERALETDPRNDDIAHQLAALATPVRPQVAVPTPVSPAAIDPDRELAFLESGLGAPRRDLGAIPTPPMAQDAISSMPLAPTPDAAMRAVDFDQVNASLSARPVEPIDIAFDDPVVDAAPVAPVESAPAPAEGEASTEPDARPSVDLAGHDDPFVFADDELSDVPLAEATGASPVDLDAAFEEGLVTAGWPDPDELTAVATPRTLTPLSVEVTPDAVEAFGREADDPVIIPPSEPEIEVLGEEADLTGPTAFAEAPVVGMDAEAEGALEPAPTAATEVEAELETTPLLEAEAEAQPEAETEVASVVETVVETVAATSDDELPWLAPETEAVDDVAAIAHAMEADARAAGENDEVAIGTPTPSHSPAFVTETMGELLVAQGFVDRAIVVYEELVERRPYDPVLSARLAELREQLAASAPTPAPVFTARERYATLAARRVVRRTPVRPYTPITTAALTPAFTPVSSPKVSGSISAVSSEGGANRAYTPLTAPAVSGDESLSSLFGAEALSGDDSAAQTLADAFAPVPLDAGTPEGFASTFLGASEAGRAPTPAYGAGRQPTPVAVPPVVANAPAEAGGEFSFDRFFPDPAASSQSSSGGATANAANPVSPAETDPSASEDLAQFSAWLKGLGQS